jgi:multiple sugar transport system substrate-binding protein
MLKKMIFVVAAGLMIVGCSNNTGEKNKSGVAHIKFSHPTGNIAEKTIFETLVKNFNATHKDIKVELVINSNYYQKLQMEMAGGTCPDVFFMHSVFMPAYAEKGTLLKLDDYIKEEKIDLKDFYPQAIESLKWKGNIYGLASGYSPLVLYYNKDIFDVKKVEYPDDSWTWKELVDAAVKLTERDNRNLVKIYGFSMHYNLDWASVFIYQNNGKLYSDDGKQMLLNTPAAKEGFNFFLDLGFKHKVMPLAIDQQTQMTWDLFLTGRVAMIMDGRWMMPSYSKAKFKWDIAQLPKGKKRASLLAINGKCIWSQTKHPKESMQFLAYLVDEGSKMNIQYGMEVPARKSLEHVILDPSPVDLPRVSNQVFLNSAKYGYDMPHIVYYERVYGEIGQLLESVYTGKKKFDDVVDEIVQKANKTINTK